ncbi:MAG: hypothetical protein LBJ31_06615 [Treponema sp.]|nr:hypothetical protein [Treponema sp.]
MGKNNRKRQNNREKRENGGKPEISRAESLRRLVDTAKIPLQYGMVCAKPALNHPPGRNNNEPGIFDKKFAFRSG